MKTCKVCLAQKQTTEFRLHGGYYSRSCVACLNEQRRTAFAQNPELRTRKRQADLIDWHKHKEKRIAASKKWAQENPDKMQAYARAYKQRNKDKLAKRSKLYVERNTEKRKATMKMYRDANKAKGAEAVRRRQARLLQRTPSWLTADDIWLMSQAYELAVLRTKLFGFAWHVDHVLPLKGKLVSGLHTPYNLQVIPALENLRKSNRVSVA
jgi:hypothetical protein